MAGVAGLIYIIVKIIRYATKKQWQLILIPNLPPILRNVFWPSVIILLFSMAIPFIWGLDFLRDFLPYLRQFRAVGRFGWVFYYVITITAAYYFYLFYRKKIAPFRINYNAAFFILIFIIWCYDAWNNVVPVRNFVENNHFAKEFNKKNYDDIIAKSGKNKTDFQAIVAIPYYNQGSEKLYIQNSGISLFHSLATSYSTGLPIMNSWISRASLSQCYKQVQLISPDIRNKIILNEIDKEKPLLLLKALNENYTDDEENILSKGVLFYQDNEIELYELPISSLQSNQQEIIDKFASKIGLTKCFETIWIEDTICIKDLILYQHFDKSNTEKKYAGNGAEYIPKGKFDLINKNMLIEYDSILYEISVWVHSDKYIFSLPILFGELKNKNGKITTIYYEGKTSTDVDEDWVKIKYIVALNKGNNMVNFWLEGTRYFVDELLFRPKEKNIFIRNPSNKNEFLYNNNRLKLTDN